MNRRFPLTVGRPALFSSHTGRVRSRTKRGEDDARGRNSLPSGYERDRRDAAVGLVSKPEGNSRH